MTTGQKLGYIRVSSADQNTARQLDGLVMDETFEEKVSGKSTNRPMLKAMLKHARKGDSVFVHSMDRLARNLGDLLAIVKTLTDKGVSVHFQKEALVFTGEDNAMAKLMLGIMGAVAEFERDIIKSRQREGIDLAKKRGAYKGRKPSLSAAQVAEVKSRAAGGEAKSDLAKVYAVSRETIYKALR